MTYLGNRVASQASDNGSRLIFVDNKLLIENELGIEDLLKMADQPLKFRLSNYLIRKVNKERARRSGVDYIESEY